MRTKAAALCAMTAIPVWTMAPRWPLSVRRPAPRHSRLALILSTTGRLYPQAQARCTWAGVGLLGRPASSRIRRTSAAVGDGGRGSTVFGIPTVRIPCECRASRHEASLHASSPANERMAGVVPVATRVIA
jgi:hypothetical protein